MPAPTLRLDSERFYLRPLGAEDATETYVGWLNDPEINRFLEVRHTPQDLPSVRAFIAGHGNEKNFLFGIFRRDDDRHIGNYRLQVTAEHRYATLGVIIGARDHWGEGVVLETRARLLDFIFESLAVDKVCGGCYQTNIHAIFNYRRQGWATDGVRVRLVIDGDRRVDTINFAMFKEIWQGRHV